MKSTEKLLALIEQGDPVPILAQDSLVEIFNELLQYDLIDIINDRVVLTSKGIEAKSKGMDSVLAELKVQEELKELSTGVQERENNLFKWSLALCLSFVALFIAASLTDCL